MNLTRRLCTLLFVLPPLAASHGCSVNMSETSGAPPASAPHSGASTTTTRAPRGSARAPAPTSADEGEDETDEQAWESIRKALGKTGDLRDGVLAFVFPRDDLNVTIQGNDIPVAAGLSSEFRFYRCPCGLLNVVGQFVVADYEANDVVDALREGHVEIASVGPLLLHERPRLLLIRFQGENKRGGVLAGALRTALSWTGEERMAPQQRIVLPK
jgi:hypothetical protein